MKYLDLELLVLVDLERWVLFRSYKRTSREDQEKLEEDGPRDHPTK